MSYEILLIVYLLVALCLVFLILIQQGKGADMGASFGAGASNTLFGATGSGNFLTKSTATLATVFFALSIVLGNLTAKQTKQVDEWQDLSVGEAVSSQQVGDVPSVDTALKAQAVSAETSGDVPVVSSQDDATATDATDAPSDK